MPPLSENELEEQLSIVGQSLVQAPFLPNELLPLLDQIGQLLSKVGQSPSKSMQTALFPLVKALAMEKLLKHSDGHVKVGIASCISEIIRITAPDAPYDDDKMKDVFQLIVSSFKNLSDIYNRSYGKRQTMLEIIAKVRSCVIMLDLECDEMIIEMFQHFLKTIRSHHPEIIFASMETIMTLVFEESDDIFPELLTPILATLKNRNEAAKTIAKKLAERVIQNSAVKLRPYLIRAIKSLNTSPDDYCETVASLCREDTTGAANSNKNFLNHQPATVGPSNVRVSSPQREVETLKKELRATQIREKQLRRSNNKLTEEIQSAGAKYKSLEKRVRALEIKNNIVEEKLRLVAQEGFDEGLKRYLSTEHGQAYLRGFWEEQKAHFLKSSEFVDHIQFGVAHCLNYDAEEGFDGPPFDKDVTIDNALDLEGWDAIDDLAEFLV